MIVLWEEQHDIPLVEVAAVLRGGSAGDPAGAEGTARHAAELMRRGAGSRTRAQLDEALDTIGASLEVETSWDAVTFSGRCLTRHMSALVDQLADVLARPSWPTEEHEKLRRESVAFLDEIRDDDGALASRFFDREVLAGHPYGRSALGTPASLAAMTREMAVAWAARRVAQDNLIVGFAGDLDGTDARALAVRLGADLPLRAPAATTASGTTADAGPSTIPTPSGRRTILVDKPERAQSQIVLGCPAPAYAAPDWLPLAVGAAVFGGTFTSRLMTEVRVKRGWSYGASCRVGRGRAGAATRIRVFPSAEQTPDTLALVLAMWEDIVTRGITAAELTAIKAYLEGRWAFEIDTPGKRLDRRLDGLVLGLRAEDVPRFVPRLRAITRAQVNDAIRRWWRPADAVITLTATAEDMLPRLSGVGLGAIEVLPFDSY